MVLNTPHYELCNVFLPQEFPDFVFTPKPGVKFFPLNPKNN